MKTDCSHLRVCLVLLAVLCMHTSAYGQLEWTKYEGNPVMASEPSAWEGIEIKARSLLKDGELYKMWYEGGRRNTLYGNAIGYATSQDGTTWERSSANPVLTLGEPESWDGYAITGPAVLFDGTVYHMWYTGGWNRFQIGYAYSLDGIDWIKYADNPVLTTGPAGSWDEGQVLLCNVILVDKVFHMWYVGEGAGTGAQIGYATSGDGLNWTKSEHNPVLTGGPQYKNTWEMADHWTGSVIKNGDKFRMYYASHPIAGTGDIRIGLAESANGVDWVRYEGNPILDFGSQGAWEYGRVLHPTVVFAGSQYTMLYAGGPVSTPLRVGLAASMPYLDDVKVNTKASHLDSIPTLSFGILPQAKISSNGTNDAFDVAVTCRIVSGSDVLYSDLQTVGFVKGQDIKFTEVTFAELPPLEPGLYDIAFWTEMAGDENPGNDTLHTSIRAINLIEGFEKGMAKWSCEAGWGRITYFGRSGKISLYSLSNPVPDNCSESAATAVSIVDLSGLSKAYLSFYTVYNFKDNESGLVEVSSDRGANWQQVGEAITGKRARFAKMDYSLNDFCGAGNEEVGIRFRIINDTTTAFPDWYIDEISLYPNEETGVRPVSRPAFPSDFSLQQNFPNPFNPGTTIAFTLPVSCRATLKIYNLQGQEVATLVSEKLGEGEHRTEWDAAGLPSGVYFYTLEAANFRQAKKLLLLR